MTNQQVSIRTLPNLYPETQDVYSVTVTGLEKYTKQIKTVVTKDAEMVDHWIQQIYSDYKEDLDRCAKNKDDYGSFMVALDVQWKPAAHDNQAPIAIFKICVGSCSWWYSYTPARCLIFQISRCYQLPKSLHKFLGDDNLRFAGLDIDCVARKLEKEFDLSVKNSVDLRDLVAMDHPEKKKEVKTLDLMKLAKIVFRTEEIERPRDVVVSNWNQKYLTQPQIMYAVLDAYVTFKIGHELDYLIDD